MEEKLPLERRLYIMSETFRLIEKAREWCIKVACFCEWGRRNNLWQLIR